MNNEEMRNWYLDLPDPQKQIFLAVLSNNLTIHGRTFGLDLEGEEQTKAFKGLNELHHQISQHKREEPANDDGLMYRAPPLG
jgi:hypothetical protein